MQVNVSTVRLALEALQSEATPANPADSSAPGHAPGDAASPNAGLRALYGLLPTLRHREVPPQQPPADGDVAARQQQADEIANGGGLQSPGVQPPPTQEELDALAARINAADDDEAVRISNDPRALAIATPEQKAALIRKLADGSTGDSEEEAITRIVLSCTSRDEHDKVIAMAGGMEELEDELEDGQLDQIVAHGSSLMQKQEAAVQKAVELLELARTPQEFLDLYDRLGGERLKHKVPQPANAEMLARLDALGEKFGVHGVGFGMPPEKTIALQGAVQKAIDSEDNDAIVQLSENADAMRAASPEQKARMIRVLQDGWTKDRQDMAIARILGGCGSKAEFDRVVDMAGGRGVIDDVDFPEAKADINKTMGGFDRVDCADNKALAETCRGALMPPQIDALTATREPTDAERDTVLGAPPAGARNGAETSKGIDDVRRRTGDAAHDLSGDPLARNKLALENRQRQVEGKPPLDYTSLVTRAYEVANSPAFHAEVDRTIAEMEKQVGPLDGAKRQDIREQMLEKRLGAVAREFGLSEQSFKSMVTSRMGSVLRQGAAEIRALSNDPATRLWADRLEITGATAASLFKVPPSFAEDFVAAMSVLADVLAVAVNVIPGVGSAISAAYFGVKAVVALAQGDILGAFKAVLSAVPGVGGALGAAGAAISAGAKVAQAGIAAGEAVATGNPLAIAGALGGLAGSAGIDLNKFVPAEVSRLVASDTVQTAVKHGVTAGQIVDGVVRGDVGAVAGALPGELRLLGAKGLADQIESLGSSPAAQAFRDTVGHAAGFAGALGARDVAGAGEALQRWMPQLVSHAASQAISELADEATRLLGLPDLKRVSSQGSDAVRETKRILQQLAALESRVDEVRQFEDAASAFARRHVNPEAIAATLLRSLEGR